MRRHGWRWAGGVAAFLLGTGLFACGVEETERDQSYPAMTTLARTTWPSSDTIS